MQVIAKGFAKHSALALLIGSVLAPWWAANAAVVPAGVQLAEKQELVRNNGSEPASLDVQKVSSDVEFNIISDFFDGLVRQRADNSVEPRLASSWETKDQKVWIFHLRPDAKWSNGDPITADDVVYSWQRLVDPATASPYGSYLASMHMANAEAIVAGKAKPSELGVKAIDSHTLEVTLDQPLSYFLQMLTHAVTTPLSKVALEKYGDKWTQPGNFVSSGAFTLSEWVVNEKVVGVRNKNYWNNEHTVLNKVTYLPVVSSTADVNRYRAGEIDITSTIPETQFASLKKTIGEQVHISDKLGTYYYMFNTTKAPFDNPKVRLALSLALDRDVVADKILGQGQKPAYTVLPPNTGGFDLKSPDYASWTQTQRNAEAKKLLAEAGFDEKHPLKFNLLYNTSESHQRIAIAASSMWKKALGVDAVLQNQEWKVMLDTMRRGNYDVVRYAWIGDYNDPSTFFNNYKSTDLNNNSNFKNADYDKVLDDAVKSSSKEDTKKLYQQANDILAKQVPAAPLYYYVGAKLVKPYVGGFNENLMGYVYSSDIYIIKH